MQKHVYFFIIENGQPKVYVTQQNQGNENNYMYFNETANAEIKQGFTQIVEGQSETSYEVTNKTNGNYENNKLLASKVLIKMLGLSESEIDEFVRKNSNTTYRLDNIQAMPIWETGVTLPEEVTVITGSPLAAGMFTYHNNGDGTVRSYPVPSHYHDKAWSDPVKGKELANKVISDSSIMDISNVSDEAAQKLSQLMENDI